MDEITPHPTDLDPVNGVMTPAKFRDCLDAMRWSQRGLANTLNINETTVHRWATGERPVPSNVAAWLNLISVEPRRSPFPRDWFKLDNSGSGAPEFGENGKLIPVTPD